MTASPWRIARAPIPWLAVLVLLALPRPASADLTPEPELRLSLDRTLLAAAAPAPADVQAAPRAAPAGDLDFDLLGAPAAPAIRYDDAAMKKRRAMLDWHQKLGFGLVALEIATTVVGQLNYSDKYGANPPVTGRYELSHAVLAYSTLAVFAVNGAVALLAPPNPVKREGYDRMTVHKVGMALATAGMIAQGVLGVYADQREGRIDQGQVARAHLAIGYATLAAVGVAVGALVF